MGKGIAEKPAREAAFEYRCRLCGKVYSDQTTSENLERMILLHIGHGIDLPEIKVGSIPKMVELHATCKKGVGVADLIGFTIKEAERS